MQSPEDKNDTDIETQPPKMGGEESVKSDAEEKAETQKLMRPKVEPKTPDLEMTEEEKEFRARPEWHRRLNRRPHQPITKERFDELDRLQRQGLLSPKQLWAWRLAWAFGYGNLSESSMDAIRAADARQARKNKRRLEMQARGAYYRA